MTFLQVRYDRFERGFFAAIRKEDDLTPLGFTHLGVRDYLFEPEEKHLKTDPHAYILEPVYDAIVEPENQNLVGFLIAITPFGNLLDRLLPEGKEGVIGVFKDDCGNVMTSGTVCLKSVHRSHTLLELGLKPVIKLAREGLQTADWQ